jgi:hypothetical protein
MLADRLVNLGQRFLSTRSFELIVAPALADVEFEHRGVTTGSVLAVCRAFAGAVVEDVINDLGQTALFVALALIPACYYAFLVLLCLPGRVAFDGTTLTLALLAAVLSVSPAVACYWPDPLPKRDSQETP